jgi:NTP pyrophosphatase (non-canonical NTP hydrolase)
MNTKEYQRLAMRTETNPTKSLDRVVKFSERSIRVLHACLGMSGEVGEISGAIEKWLMYQQTLDTINLREELGDLLWYMAQLCNALDFDLEDIMETNILKLRHRYPDKFSSEKALEQNRDREGEREILATPIQKKHPSDLNSVKPLNTDCHPTCTCKGSCEVDLKPMQPETNSYKRLCCVCGIARIHNHNKSELCPDCAADKRRLKV